MEIEILARARTHIETIGQFYAERQSGAGRRFLDDVRELILLIARYPDSMPRLKSNVVGLRGIRVGKLRRFPHLVFYRRVDQRVQIIAILHGKQDYYRLLEPEA